MVSILCWLPAFPLYQVNLLWRWWCWGCWGWWWWRCWGWSWIIAQWLTIQPSVWRRSSTCSDFVMMKMILIKMKKMTTVLIRRRPEGSPSSRETAAHCRHMRALHQPASASFSSSGCCTIAEAGGTTWRKHHLQMSLKIEGIQHPACWEFRCFLHHLDVRNKLTSSHSIRDPGHEMQKLFSILIFSSPSVSLSLFGQPLLSTHHGRFGFDFSTTSASFSLAAHDLKREEYSLNIIQRSWEVGAV